MPWTVRLAVPVLSRIAPRATIDSGLDLGGISRDSAAVAAYTGDPLFQRRTTPRLGAEVLRSMRRVSRQADRLRPPLLILHGEADRIVPATGGAAFFQRAGSSDKRRLTYPGAGHNLLIETNRAQVFADVVQWVVSGEFSKKTDHGRWFGDEA